MSQEALDITPVLQQRLAWDIAPCDEIDDLWKYLNLIPPSPDVADTAHEESHRRMATVESLSVVGEIYITLAGEIISKLMVKQYEDLHGEQPGITEQSVMNYQNTEVIRGALFPIIAHMLETGMLQLGPTAYATASGLI